MNKRDAKKLAESGTLIVRDLSDMVSASRGKREFSRVNPSIPYEHVLGIYDAVLSSRDPASTFGGMKADPYTGRLRPSKDSLAARNILVDCAP